MRPIEFRGKRTDNGEWVYGYFFMGFTGIAYILVLHDHILRMTEYYEVDINTVGQFTGQFDIKENKIYEGQLVEYEISKLNMKSEDFFELVKTVGRVQYSIDSFWVDPYRTLGEVFCRIVQEAD